LAIFSNRSARIAHLRQKITFYCFDTDEVVITIFCDLDAIAPRPFSQLRIRSASLLELLNWASGAPEFVPLSGLSALVFKLDISREAREWREKAFVGS
jgi:hypothetical protein